ncbi:MAG: prolyl oligopeptidase family serine peptidase, partial [Aquirufa sp.]
VDYSMTVLHPKSQQIWDTPTGKIMPLVDQFDLTKKFTYNEKLTMSYATFSPKVAKEKAPLIIWLHGGGEGGTDPTIPLLGNKAANYASPAIQALFDGAYVLSPQCPGAWMHNAQGVGTQGKDNDIYNEGLMALIKDYVKSNPQIDPTRIYVGGCSNGGYMALKLILLYPDYFAAGYISALAYRSEYIADADLQKIKNIPIWFVHSKDDMTTIPDLTVVPVFNRLRTMGAKNVHFTYYDHVNDITNFYGGSGFQYNGHWSWVYLHENLPRTDLDGSPVRINGKPVSIMEWMAAQKKGK